jgi:hypothetical protein
MLQPRVSFCVAGMLVALANGALAAPFTEGNLVILQVGDEDVGVNASDDASPAILKEVDPADPDGTLVQRLALPTEISGNNRRFTLTSNLYHGHMSRSANGLFLVMGGYDAEVGALRPNEADPLEVHRVIARVDNAGVVDTSTALNDCFGLLRDKGGVHTVASSDGTKFWLGGRANSGSNAGVRFAVFGAPDHKSVRINSNNNYKEPRVINVFDGQLYSSFNLSSARGVHIVGSGLPETPVAISQIEFVEVPDSCESGSPYDFWIMNEDTVYLVDDRTPPCLGGVNKYTRDTDPLSPTFGDLIYRYTLNAGLRSDAQAVGSLAAKTNEQGQAVLYVITHEEQQAYQTRLMVATDTGNPATDTFVTLQTAPEGTIFRSVDFAPRPCVGEECIGACCKPGGGCENTVAESCTGAFQGAGTSCETITCPLVCSDPFADLDGDMDVDQGDFGLFQACFTGPVGTVVDGCKCADRPEENFPTAAGDVDACDMDVFNACADTSGPTIQVDPACDD